MRSSVDIVAPRLATICAVLGGLGIAGLHAARPELNPLHRFVSEYAVDVNGSHWGWLMQAVFLTLAACSSIVATMVRGRAAWPLGFGAAGMVIMFACPTDLNVAPVVETRVGRIHDFTALTTFVLLLIAMLGVARQLHRAEPKSKTIVPSAFGFFVAAAVTLSIQIALLAAQSRPYQWAGTTERILIAELLIWCVWISNKARTSARP